MTPKIQSIVTKFVEDLTLAIQQEGAAAFAAAIGGGGGSVGNGRRTTPKKATSLILPPRPRGQKRDPQVLADLVTSTLSYIKKNPGQRLEQIALGMKVPTSELKLPIQKLLADRSMTKKGVKRATSYKAR